MENGLDVTVAGAVLAALGYVGKQFIDLASARLSVRRARRASLVKLHTLLRAGRAIFDVQNDLARGLVDEIEQRHPGAAAAEDATLEDILAAAYPDFTPAERQLHSVIRGQTIHGLRPINRDISDWLSSDDYYKTGTAGTHWSGDQPFVDLMQKLAILEAHLRLWHAKFEAWIPEHPEHALIYMGDEARHGVGFPRGLDDLVAKLAKAPRYQVVLPDPDHL
jgi:hypothetical protein